LAAAKPVSAFVMIDTSLSRPNWTSHIPGSISVAYQSDKFTLLSKEMAAASLAAQTSVPWLKVQRVVYLSTSGSIAGGIFIHGLKSHEII